MHSPIDRVLLPLGPEGDQPHLLRAATVFSVWFDAPLQIVCGDGEALSRYQVLAGTLGVRIEPVLCLDDPFGPGLVAHAHSHGPSIIVTEPTEAGRTLAATSTQPVYLVTDTERRRVPVGPLVTEMTGSADDLDALALTAVLARSLDESVRLVSAVGDDATADSNAQAEARLRQMGCEVGIDVIDAGDLPPIVVAGRTRDATAIVITADRLTEPGLVDASIEAGVNLFVAPRTDPEAGRPALFTVDHSTPIDRAPIGARLEQLDRTECLARLDRHTVARVGYVEAGWPVVVPVNYRLHDGAVFIRSLAGGKLRAAERGDTVCLELDGYDESLRTGWSVIAHGLLEVIGDPAVLNEAWANDPHPWVASDSWQWLRMVPISLTGREVWPSAAD